MLSYTQFSSNGEHAIHALPFTSLCLVPTFTSNNYGRIFKAFLCPISLLYFIHMHILHIYMPRRFMSARAPYPSHKNNTLHSNLFWPSQDGWGGGEAGGSFLHRCHNGYSSFTSTLSPYLTLFSVYYCLSFN